MTNSIYTYTLIRTLYDEKNDYIDSFIPLVINTLKPNIKVTIDKIAKNILDKYDVNVPLYSLEVILNRAKRNGYILITDKRIFLSAEGISYKEECDNHRDIDRRINELIADARMYLNESGCNIGSEDVKKIILDFIKDNLASFDIFLDKQFIAPEINRQRFSADIQHTLINYFLILERQKHALFKTLQDIIFGSIISVSVYSQSFSEISMKFDKITVYLDSNFVFSLLGLHHKDRCKPVIQMYELMTEARVFNFKIFDITLNEMISVLARYKNEYGNYLRDVPVDSIYSHLKQKGWKPSTVTEYISNIDRLLIEKSISIANTNVKIEDYEISSDRLKKLSEYKSYQSEKCQKHDLIAIDKIKALRRDRVTKIENAKAIFLTSDIKLARFNQCEDHKDTGTVNEVIPDKLLANLLWLKKPKNNINIPIASLIASYKSERFVCHNVWDKLISRIKELRNNNAITETDIGSLLYDRQFYESLIDYNNSDVNSISNEFIISSIDDIKQKEEAIKLYEKQKDISRVKEFEQEVAFKLSEIEYMDKQLNISKNETIEALKTKDVIVDRLLSKITAAKADIYVKSQQSSILYMNLYKVSYSILVTITILLTYRHVITNWYVLEPIYAVISLLVLALMFGGLKIPSVKSYIKHMGKKYQQKVHDRLTSENILLTQLESELNEII